jgi:hypothetical protein
LTEVTRGDADEATTTFLTELVFKAIAATG